MKLTPWMLTVATFLMVGAIAVSYLFKRPESGLHSRQLVAGQVPGLNRSVAVSPLPPTEQPKHMGDSSQVSPRPEEPITDPPIESTSEQIVDAAPKPPALPNVPKGEVSGSPDPPPGFVTEQYRSADRIDVRFIEGQKVVVPEVAATAVKQSR